MSYNGNDFYKTCHLTPSLYGYELSLNRNYAERDLTTGYLKDYCSTFEVAVKRWNFETNTYERVLDKHVFLAVNSMIDGEIKYIYKTFDDPTTDDPKAIFELDGEEYQNLSSVKFYITDDNTSSGNELTFEEVGISANGRDGSEIEYIYYNDGTVEEAHPNGFSE